MTKIQHPSLNCYSYICLLHSAVHHLSDLNLTWWPPSQQIHQKGVLVDYSLRNTSAILYPTMTSQTVMHYKQQYSIHLAQVKFILDMSFSEWWKSKSQSLEMMCYVVSKQIQPFQWNLLHSPPFFYHEIQRTASYKGVYLSAWLSQPTRLWSELVKFLDPPVTLFVKSGVGGKYFISLQLIFQKLPFRDRIILWDYI